MNDTHTIFLIDEDRRRRAVASIQAAPTGYVVQIKPRTRSLDANAAMWPILQAFSDQLRWPVNGHMTAMSPEEWKHVLSAAFRQESARLAMGLDGGVVMLGQRTSKFSKAQFSEWLDFLKATAADRGVNLAEVEAFA